MRALPPVTLGNPGAAAGGEDTAEELVNADEEDWEEGASAQEEIETLLARWAPPAAAAARRAHSERGCVGALPACLARVRMPAPRADQSRLAAPRRARRLSSKHRRVVRLRHGLPLPGRGAGPGRALSFREIGDALGITGSWAGVLYKQAMLEIQREQTRARRSTTDVEAERRLIVEAVSRCAWPCTAVRVRGCCSGLRHRLGAAPCLLRRAAPACPCLIPAPFSSCRCRLSPESSLLVALRLGWVQDAGQMDGEGGALPYTFKQIAALLGPRKDKKDSTTTPSTNGGRAAPERGAHACRLPWRLCTAHALALSPAPLLPGAAEHWAQQRHYTAVKELRAALPHAWQGDIKATLMALTSLDFPPHQQAAWAQELASKRAQQEARAQKEALAQQEVPQPSPPQSQPAAANGAVSTAGLIGSSAAAAGKAGQRT